VCQQLGIPHHVFNFTAEFEREVVGPYVAAHARATTPNPCIACNAHLKFDRFLQRARLLGFDAIVTGHHARVTWSGGVWQLRRGKDAAKDQSYVLYMLGQPELAQLRLPVGELTKQEVRRLAARIGLRTADKPDSQDVCFISKAGGRASFLAGRIPLGPGRLITATGDDLGPVDALELVTVGQRRGLGLTPHKRPERRYVVNVDLSNRTATLGALDDLMVRAVALRGLSWTERPLWPGSRVQAQLSAHGVPASGRWEGAGSSGAVVLDQRVRRVAAGQAVVLYAPDDAGDIVAGGGTAA
jgi:tRNA-specific 2-thiouridylase